jgi:hypothetical protein
MGEKIFDASGWFAINNAVFDVIMPNLSPNAFKVLCVAIRQTWGWVADPQGDPKQRRDVDRISYSQFKEKAGIGSYSTVSRAVSECLEAGYLIRHKVGEQQGTKKPLYAYSLNTDYELAATTETVVEKGSTTETVVGATTETVAAATTETVVTNINRNKQTNDVVGNTKNKAIKTTLLTTFGVTPSVSKQLSEKCSLEDIRGWIEYANRAKGLRNPVAFVVSRLRDGEPVPENSSGATEDRRRDSEGKYRDYIQT